MHTVSVKISLYFGVYFFDQTKVIEPVHMKKCFWVYVAYLLSLIRAFTIHSESLDTEEYIGV